MSDVGYAIIDLLGIIRNHQFLLRAERENVAKAKTVLKPFLDAADADMRAKLRG